jgi:hypothetical protein
LQSRFHYWTFVLGSQGVNVSFKLDLQETDAVTLHVGLLNGTNKVNHWEAVVLKPGELLASGMPTGTSWLNKLPPAFDGGLLQQHNQEVLDSLKAVAPVGKETIFMPPPATPDILPRAVLALDSTEYNDLSECQFKLRYNWNVGGIATIHSSGIGMHAPFSGVTPPFDGIVVQLEDFSQGNNKLTMNQLLQNLPNLTPVEFFLEKIKGPGSE